MCNQTATSNFIIVMVLMLLWPAARMFGHFFPALNWYLIYNLARNIPGMFSQKQFLLVSMWITWAMAQLWRQWMFIWLNFIRRKSKLEIPFECLAHISTSHTQKIACPRWTFIIRSSLHIGRTKSCTIVHHKRNTKWHEILLCDTMCKA